MRRAVAIACVAGSLLALVGCRRTPAAKTDAHLDAGYARLLDAPQEALREFERSTDRKGAKEYALAQAHEALGELDRAKAHYERALEQRAGFVKAQAGRARIDLLQGRTDAALRHLAEVVRKAPDELPSLLLYGVAARSADDRQRALAALTAWPSRTPRNKPPAEYFLVLAALKRTDDAASSPAPEAEQARAAPLHSIPGALVLTKLAVMHERPWLARALLARVAREKLQSDQATTVASLALGLHERELAATAARSIRAFPANGHAELVFAQLELAEDARRAIKHLTTALALLPAAEPARRQAELLLVQAYTSERDFERASALVKDLLGRAPTLEVELLTARVDTARGAPQEAILRLERLRAQQREVPAILEELSLARLAAGDGEGAVRAARERLALVPRDARALHALIELLLTRGSGAEATSELEARLQAEPGSESLWLLLAQATERSGKPGQLRQVLQRYAAALPQSEAAWLSLARLEERERRPDAVRQALDRALAAQPASTSALQHLAELSLRQEQWQEAATVYERLVEATPNDAGAWNNLGYLYADRLEQPERAVLAAEQAHRLASDQPAIADTLAWALLRRGHPEDRKRALDLLQRARASMDQDDVRLHLALALHVTGSQARARELLVGFRFRPGDPGHAFARAKLALD